MAEYTYLLDIAIILAVTSGTISSKTASRSLKKGPRKRYFLYPSKYFSNFFKFYFPFIL